MTHPGNYDDWTKFDTTALLTVEESENHGYILSLYQNLYEFLCLPSILVNQNTLLFYA